MRVLSTVILVASYVLPPSFAQTRPVPFGRKCLRGVVLSTGFIDGDILADFKSHKILTDDQWS